VAVGFRSGLPLQVDLGGVVDGDDAVVPHDDVRGVGVVNRAAEAVRVAVDDRIESAGAEREGVGDLAGIKSFREPVMRPDL